MKKRYLKVLIGLFILLNISTSYCVYSKNVIVGEVENVDIQKEEYLYDIEIYWDNMNFTYNETKDIKWDDEEKQYYILTENEWIIKNNKINIRNFSDKTIIVIFKYEPNKKGMGIVGKFNKDKIEITKNNQEEITFSMAGTINSDKEEYIKVGRIIMSVQ